MKARFLNKKDEIEKKIKRNNSIKTEPAVSPASPDLQQKNHPVKEGSPMNNNITTKSELQKSKDKPPKNSPQAQAPTTILEEEQPAITSPISLVEGKAYVTLWKKVKISNETEEVADSNMTKTIRSAHKNNERMIVLRDDGQIFGLDKHLSELGIDINLGEKPDPKKTWSSKGVNKYIQGYRPSATDVFERIVQLLDHFIDFSKSLADQRTMGEFLALWLIGTWMIPAFKITGYIWVNGQRGSGKSDLLALLSEIGYLGIFISSSSSFASLRDMAEYGATLCFDDAESITYQNDKDQDKRSLLLAGNRSGITITVKVPGPKNSWVIKRIKAFTSKAFSAIRVPDPTLASRSILIPMVRTSDKSRGNIDPFDHDEWTCEWRELIDDLWGLTLVNLSQMPKWEKWAGEKSTLLGRDLQPWRGIFAIAGWMEKNGVQGLFQRMNQLSLDYQKERIHIELPDLTRFVFQALGDCAISAIRANSAINKNGYFITNAAELVIKIVEINTEEDAGLNPEKITSRIVGSILGQLRYSSAPRPGGMGPRLWRIDLTPLVQQAESYNVILPVEITRLVHGPFQAPLLIDGTDGINGTDGTKNINLNEAIANYDPRIKPERPCHNCKNINYRQRPDGGWVCNICHPGN